LSRTLNLFPLCAFMIIDVFATEFLQTF